MVQYKHTHTHTHMEHKQARRNERPLSGFVGRRGGGTLRKRESECLRIERDKARETERGRRERAGSHDSEHCDPEREVSEESISPSGKKKRQDG